MILNDVWEVNQEQHLYNKMHKNVDSSNNIKRVQKLECHRTHLGEKFDRQQDICNTWATPSYPGESIHARYGHASYA